MVIVNVYNSYKNKTGKMRSPMEAARPFFPFITFLTLFLYWMYKSPNNVMDLDTRAVFLLTGTIFSNVSVSDILSAFYFRFTTNLNNYCLTNDKKFVFLFEKCRLIVAQMSNTRCEAFHWMTPIFFASLFISLFIPLLERPLIYLLCILTTAAHWHYGTRVVS